MSGFPLIKRILKFFKASLFFPSPLHFTEFRQKGPKCPSRSGLSTQKHQTTPSMYLLTESLKERGYLKPKTVLPAATFYTMYCSCINDNDKIHSNTVSYKEISNTDSLLIVDYPRKTYKQLQIFQWHNIFHSNS